MMFLMLFQSTPSARRATLIVGDVNIQFPISIHALREEGDFATSAAFTLRTDFNPRPPRGGRQMRQGMDALWKQFQSTPSARRATLHPR